MMKPLMHFTWLVLVLSVLSSSVRAGTLGDLTYSISDGQVTITDCNEAAQGELVIPAEIEGLPVTSIRNAAFKYCERLTSVTIPDSVTSIGYDAFALCYGLESITLPAAFHSRRQAHFIGDHATRELWGTSGYTTHSNNTQPPTTPTTPTIQPSIRMAPVIMVQGEEGSVKTIEVADSPDGPWRFWMDVTATASGVAITDLDGQAHKRFYRLRD